MINNRLVKNASWIIGCKIAQSVLSFIIGMISARYLGPSNYGLITYAASVVAFVVPLVQLGLRNTIVEELISHPEREGEVMGSTLGMTMASSLLGVAGIAAFTSLAHAGERDTVIVCTLHSIGLVFQMTEMIQYWFQAKLLSKYTAVVSLVAYSLVSAYRVFLLVTAKSIHWFSVVTALDYFIIPLVLLVIYRRLGGQRLSFSMERCRKMFKKSRYYIISGMMVTVFSQTDKLMIKAMIGDEANGFYSAAITTAGLAAFVFQAIIDSFRPVILEAKKKNPAAFETNMIRLYSIIIYLGLMQSVFFTVLAPWIIPVIYGDKYLGSILLLRIITWYSSFSYMGSVRNIWILAEGRQKCLWIINLCGALLNVGANAALIPYFGAAGAAIASVATQFFTNFVLNLILSPIRPTTGLILRSLDPRVPLGLIREAVSGRAKGRP